MEVLVLYDDGDLRISGNRAIPLTDDVFEIDTLDLALDVDSGGGSTRIVIYQALSLPLQVPIKLLVADAGAHRIRDISELGSLANDEWAALKDRIRRRLLSPFEVKAGTELFGLSAIGDAGLLFRFWLNPALLDGVGELAPDHWVLRAEGAGTVDFHYAAGNGANSTPRPSRALRRCSTSVPVRDGPGI